MMTLDPFELMRKNVSQFVTFTDDEFQAIAPSFSSRELKKKEHWLNMGSLCSEVVFIAKGALRVYYLKDGSERTAEFFFENSWFTDFESWLTRKPSAMAADVLEDSVMITIPFRNLYTLYDLYPKCERIGRLIAEATIIRMCNRNNSLLGDSPQERYIKLLEEHPYVIERVPQYHIASYLGIEPESLSRIRKKISSKVNV